MFEDQVEPNIFKMSHFLDELSRSNAVIEFINSNQKELIAWFSQEANSYAKCEAFYLMAHELTFNLRGYKLSGKPVDVLVAFLGTSLTEIIPDFQTLLKVFENSSEKNPKKYNKDRCDFFITDIAGQLPRIIETNNDFNILLSLTYSSYPATEAVFNQLTPHLDKLFPTKESLYFTLKTICQLESDYRTQYLEKFLVAALAQIQKHIKTGHDFEMMLTLLQSCMNSEQRRAVSFFIWTRAKNIQYSTLEQIFIVCKFLSAGIWPLNQTAINYFYDTSRNQFTQIVSDIESFFDVLFWYGRINPADFMEFCEQNFKYITAFIKTEDELEGVVARLNYIDVNLRLRFLVPQEFRGLESEIRYYFLLRNNKFFSWESNEPFMDKIANTLCLFDEKKYLLNSRERDTRVDIIKMCMKSRNPFLTISQVLKNLPFDKANHELRFELMHCKKNIYKTITSDLSVERPIQPGYTRYYFNLRDSLHTANFIDIEREISIEEYRILNRIFMSFPSVNGEGWPQKFSEENFDQYPQALLAIAANAYDFLGNTMLGLACEWGKNPEILEKLIGFGADINRPEHCGERTPLYWAICNKRSYFNKESRGAVAVVHCLLNHGARTDLSCNADNETPLQYAQRAGFKAAAQLISNHQNGWNRFRNFLQRRSRDTEDNEVSVTTAEMRDTTFGQGSNTAKRSFRRM